MNLFLIRHAEAFHQDNGGSDEYRPLTEKGREDAVRLGCVFNRLEITLDRIWSSPVLRADETATILNDNLKSGPGVNFKDALGIPSDFNLLRKDLRMVPNESSLALVGHMPFLGECFQYWVGGTAHPGIHLAKSSIVCLDGLGLNSGEMIVKFLLSNKVMKGLMEG